MGALTDVSLPSTQTESEANLPLGIKYEDLGYGTSNGFATVGTNNGHNGTTAIDMLNNPDIIKDFSYRA